MGKKDELVYKVSLQKYPKLGLPATLQEFRKLFPSHKKFDKEIFITDLANTIVQELGGRLDFLLNRLYPSDVPVLNSERKFLREKLGSEKLLKLYIDLRVMQLTMLNALDNMRLGKEDLLPEAIKGCLKFFRDIMFKEFAEISKVMVEGWEYKFHEKIDVEHLSYIR